MHYLFSTLIITLVCSVVFVFYFNYYVGMLCTICFLISLTITLVCCALFVFLFF